jgi:carbamoyl-phosphate synthase large subunit
MENILITSSGGSPASGVIRSLRMSDLQLNITGTDSNPWTVHRSEADATYLVPNGNEINYLPNMQSIIEDNNIDFIHCQNSSEIIYVSKYRKKLNCNYFLPSHDAIKACTDKYLSYKIWKKRGIPVPKTILIENEKDLKLAYDTMRQRIWIRATKGSAGKGALSSDNFAEIKNWVDKYNGWGKFTAAERLTNDSITWMAIMKDGELISAQGRKRHYWEFANRAPSGVTGITGLGSTVTNKQLDRISQDAIFAIDKNPNGIWCVDLTFDNQGVPNPTEINIGRFFTTVHFFTLAGFNFPEVYIRCGLDKPLNFTPPLVNPCKPNLYWLRGVDFLPKLLSQNDFDEMKKNYRINDIGVSS